MAELLHYQAMRCMGNVWLMMIIGRFCNCGRDTKLLIRLQTNDHVKVIIDMPQPLHPRRVQSA